jgi:hypothetical protein
MREDERLESPQGVFHNLNSHTNIVNKGNMMTSNKYNKFNNNGKIGTLRYTYSQNDWKNNISELFTLNASTSGTPLRSWENSYQNVSDYKTVNDDDDSFPLEAGKPDISVDPNQGNSASIPQYTNQGNNKYDVTEKAHPTDDMGQLVQYITKVAKSKMESDSTRVNQNHHDSQKNNGNTSLQKEINMLETEYQDCQDPMYPYHRTTTAFPGQYCSKQNIHFETSLNNKDFCYLDKTVPTNLVHHYGKTGVNKCKTLQTDTKNNQIETQMNNKVHAKLYLTEDQRKYYDSTVSEDKRKYKSELTLDRNQVMVDNNRTPISINMSCNQGGGKSGEKDDCGGDGYGGYGTPNLYERCVNKNCKGCYGNTLDSWYKDEGAGNSVCRRKKQWQDRDYYQYGYGQPNMSTLTNRTTSTNTIGAPFSNFTPYAPVNQNSYVDQTITAYNEVL